MSYHDNNILSIYLYINFYILANSTLNVTPLSKFHFVIYDYEVTCYTICKLRRRLSINKEGEEVTYIPLGATVTEAKINMNYLLLLPISSLGHYVVTSLLQGPCHMWSLYPYNGC